MKVPKVSRPAPKEPPVAGVRTMGLLESDIENWDEDYCDICGDEDTGEESHYHCGRCESSERTGMYGHYRPDGTWTCDKTKEKLNGKN